MIEKVKKNISHKALVVIWSKVDILLFITLLGLYYVQNENARAAGYITFALFGTISACFIKLASMRRTKKEVIFDLCYSTIAIILVAWMAPFVR